MGLAALYNAVPRIASRWNGEWFEPTALLARVAGVATLAGVLGFAWWCADGHLPLGALVLLLATALMIVVERTRAAAWPGAFSAGVLAVAATCARWVALHGDAGTYLDHLTLSHLLATVVAVIVVRREQPAGVSWWRHDATGVVAAAAVAWWAATAGLAVVDGTAPAAHFALVALDVVLVLGTAILAGWPQLVPAAAAASIVFAASWHARFFDDETAVVGVVADAIVYVTFLALPFVVVRTRDAGWKATPAPWLASALIGPATFLLFYDAWVQLAGRAWVGVVPVAMAASSVAALYGIAREFAPSADELGARRRLDYLALFAAIALGFVATAIPLQLERQWITVGWALEGAAVWWLFGRLPHPGLKYFGVLLFGAVGVRLLANPEVLRYEPRGWPILNWLLYTYGVPAACSLAGAWLLQRAERARGPDPHRDVLPGDRRLLAPAAGLLGVLLVFWLINLEIADYYSAGRYVEVDFSRYLARDLTRSFAWGLYALILLGVGIWRVVRGLRLVALAFLLLTVAKVFLYDLGQLTGLYRIVSFLALGLSLILVSLLYQRFVRRPGDAA
ncbi:MAG: DUF2339 domain-containing protein [Vicinamibacterales bacterium]